MAKGNAFKLSSVEPYGMVKLEDGVHVTAGENIVSRSVFKTFKECENYIKSKPLEIIVNTCVILTLNALKQNETNKETTKDA